MNDLSAMVLRSKKSARTRARQAEARKPTGPSRTDDVLLYIEGKPVGKGRPRFSMRQGHAYTPPRTVAAERQIAAAARVGMANHQPFDGPVSLSVVTWNEVPKSWPKKKQALAMSGEIHPTIRPDPDNVIKLICDALNHVVWNDDSQVVAITMERHYGAVSATQIVVRPIKSAQPVEPHDAAEPSPSGQNPGDDRPQDPIASSPTAT